MDFQQALEVAQVNGEDVIPTVCGMCGPGGPGGGCGIYAFVKDGRFIKVAGMASPLSTMEPSAPRAMPPPSGFTRRIG